MFPAGEANKGRGLRSDIMERLHKITQNPRFILNPPVQNVTLVHPKLGSAVIPGAEGIKAQKDSVWSA